MSEETRRDIVLIVVFSLVSATSMASVFLGCRFLARIVIVISDLYLFSVLLLAALRSDDDGFLRRHSWITRFFPRKTTGISIAALLFLAIVSGFAGLYVGAEVFPSGKTPLDALYISFFIMGFTDYSPAPGYGQLVVIAQLVSGVLLLAALFPIHISRISTFQIPCTPLPVESICEKIAVTRSSPLLRWIPAFTWLRAYDRSWLRGDVLAGVTLAAYLLPAALGDASLANLPPEAGLYACLFGGLVFWIFCGSHYTAASVTSAISLVIGSSLTEVTGGNTARFGALAAGTALLVSLIAFIAWLVKAGVMVHFISESVMTGFKCGVALFLASTQLPKLFGFHSAHGSFWENTGHFFKHLNEA